MRPESRADVDRPESRSVRQIRGHIRGAGYAHIGRDNGSAVADGGVAHRNASGHVRQKSCQWVDVHRPDLQVDVQPANDSGQERQDRQTGNEATYKMTFTLIKAKAVVWLLFQGAEASKERRQQRHGGAYTRV